MMLQFSRAPSASDSSEVARLGGSNILMLHIVKAMVFQSAQRVQHFCALPEVTWCRDYQALVDPERSVFLTVIDQVETADTAFLRAAGATLIGVDPPIGSNPPASITTVMRVSGVPLLEGYPRIASARLGQDDNVILPDPRYEVQDARRPSD